MNVYDLAKQAAAALYVILSMPPLSRALADPLQGNSSLGRQAATSVCCSCHQVIGGKGRDGPPSFVDIANMQSTTALSLKVFLRSNHKEMPNLIIPAGVTDDLIAFILSLKEPYAPIKKQCLVARGLLAALPDIAHNV